MHLLLWNGKARNMFHALYTAPLSSAAPTADSHIIYYLEVGKWRKKKVAYKVSHQPK
jgi:hypothetical protein